MSEKFPISAVDQIAKEGIISRVPGMETGEQDIVSAELYGQPVDFSQESEALLAGLGENASIEDRFDAVTGFMDSLEISLDKGEIKSGRTDIAYQPEVIAAQLAALEAAFNGRVKLEHDPMLLLPNSQGVRVAFEKLLTDGRTASVVLEVIKGKSLEALAARRVVKARRDLGGEALSEVGVHTPEVAKDPLDSLSPKDRRDVLQHQMLSREQIAAHNRGDYLASKDLKEAAFDLKTSLSPAARDALYL